MDNKQGSVYKNKINFDVETQVKEYILALQEQEMNYC